LGKLPDGAVVVVGATVVEIVEVVEVVEVVDVVEVVEVASVVEVVGSGGLGLPRANAGAPLAAREPAVIATVATNVPPAANKPWRPRP
jgi:hypothetical protein